MELKNQVALVTGAARGIGRAYALRLAKLGADVAVVDLDFAASAEFGETPAGYDLAAEIRSLGVRALAVQADLRQRQQASDAVKKVFDQFGRLDILVCNAGGAITPAGRSSAAASIDEDIELLFAANYLSTVYCCQAAASIMKAQRKGVIVNTSSEAAVRPIVGGAYAVYGDAKAAVSHFSRALALELGPHQVRVNCISPGIIMSSRVAAQAKARGIGSDKDLARVPLGRFGTVDDCANAMQFLVTELSGFVTGQVLSVCGGAVITPS